MSREDGSRGVALVTGVSRRKGIGAAYPDFSARSPADCPREGELNRLVEAPLEHPAATPRDERDDDGARNNREQRRPPIRSPHIGHERFQMMGREIREREAERHAHGRRNAIDGDELRLDHYLDFLIAEYGFSLPDYFFTVYLVPDIAQLQKLAADIHGLDASPLTLGYAFQNDLSIVAVLNGTAAGTLLHEMFHLTVRSTFGPIPQWLDEGIASLYETSTVVGARYYGEPNWRSEVINVLRGQYPKVDVANVITTPWFGDEPGQNIAEHISDQQAYTLALSRYFVMFLQERGLLKGVFAAYRDRQRPVQYVPAERQAVQLLEAATGKSMSTIAQEFSAWYPSARNPNTRFHAGQIEAKEVPRELPANVEREPAPGSGN